MRELIEGDGVTLRRWRATDVPALFEAIAGSLTHLSPWMPFAVPDYDVEDTRAFLERQPANWRTGTAYNFAIVAPDRQLAGGCGLMARIDPGGLEIGYWLRAGYTGRGLATAAVRGLVAAAFAEPGIDHVEIHHDAANERSGAVARRLGFTEIGRREREVTAASRSAVEVLWRLDR